VPASMHGDVAWSVKSPPAPLANRGSEFQSVPTPVSAFQVARSFPHPLFQKYQFVATACQSLFVMLKPGALYACSSR